MGVNATFIALALAFVPPLVVLPFVRSPTEQPHSEDQEDLNDDHDGGGEVANADSGETIHKTNWKIVVLVAVFLLLLSGIELACGSFGDVFAHDEFHWSVGEAAMMPTVFYFGFTASRLLCATVALRYFSSTALCVIMMSILFVSSCGLVFVTLFHSPLG